MGSFGLNTVLAMRLRCRRADGWRPAFTWNNNIQVSRALEDLALRQRPGPVPLHASGQYNRAISLQQKSPLDLDDKDEEPLIRRTVDFSISRATAGWA